MTAQNVLSLPQVENITPQALTLQMAYMAARSFDLGCNRDEKIILDIRQAIQAVANAYDLPQSHVQSRNQFVDHLMDIIEEYYLEALSESELDSNIYQDLPTLEELDRILGSTYHAACMRKPGHEELISYYNLLMDFYSYDEMVEKHKVSREHLLALLPEREFMPYLTLVEGRPQIDPTGIGLADTTTPEEVPADREQVPGTQVNEASAPHAPDEGGR